MNKKSSGGVRVLDMKKKRKESVDNSSSSSSSNINSNNKTTNVNQTTTRFLTRRPLQTRAFLMATAFDKSIQYFDTLRKSQSADKLLSTSTSIDNQSEGDDTSKDTNSNHTDTGIFKPGWSDIFKNEPTSVGKRALYFDRDDTLAGAVKAYLMQNLLASRWITGNQKITEDKMELDAMMVDGGSKNTTNKKT